MEGISGHGLLERLEALNGEITIWAATLLALPIAIYAGYISSLYFWNRPFNRAEAIFAAAAAIVCFGYALFRFLGLLKKRRKTRSRYEGEVMVEQALSRLLLAGYQVFHGFKADGFAIDHVVVGEKGVFALETRTPSERLTRNRHQDATVEYDGRALHFPNGTDIDMIEQAKRRSMWLSSWLSEALGEEIMVRSVISLPGWVVRRTAAEGMPIVNPKQFDSLFKHIQPWPLTADMMGRIAHLMDQKCREQDELA
ncbi:MAG: nuclease-related domain-containing protein [Desulfobacterales bacterium]